LQNDGKGHYPQCLVSTVNNVFRGLSIARSVVAVDSCERQEIKKLLLFMPKVNKRPLNKWNKSIIKNQLHMLKSTVLGAGGEKEIKSDIFSLQSHL
jgi:hypothetical protein